MSIIRSNKLPAISPGKVLQKLLKQNNLSTSESAKLLDLSLCDLTKLIEGNMQVDTSLGKRLEGFTGISCVSDQFRPSFPGGATP